MATNKKPSMYSEEELEAYGVWVKSEPQDFTASLAEAAANFNADALPYEADFDTGFDDMGAGTGGFDLLDGELNIPEISVDDNDFMSHEPGGEEPSTQMLMKIAGELSSIRSELNMLKKEFAEIRGEAGESEKTDNFFDTADFPSADFPVGEGFDAGREADEAALKELDAQNEAEEIHIDFDNLGIDLDGVEAAAEVEAETPQEELPPLEAAVDDDDFEMPSFDALSFDEAPPSASEPDDLEEVPGFAEELVPLEGEDKELKELRLEGAEPLAPPPENADYLEEDPFALNNADLEGAALEPAAVEPAAVEPAALEPAEDVLGEDFNLDPVLEDIGDVQLEDEPTVAETTTTTEIDTETEVAEEPAAPEEGEELSFDELSFDETGFDLGLDDFSAEEPAAEPVAEETVEEPVAEEPAELTVEEPAAEELAELTVEEPIAEEPVELAVEEPVAEEPAVEEAAELTVEEPVAEEPVELTVEELAEPAVEEPAELAAEPDLGDISFEDDISLDMSDFGTDIELDAKAEEPAVEPEPEPEPELDVKAEELPSDIDLDLALDQADALGTDLELDQADDFAAVDLEADLESVVAETKDADKPAAPANGIISDVDDSVIPEGFEVNAKEADPSLDDDLEAFAGELAIAGDEGPSDSADKLADDSGEFAAIPQGLKNELKNVLSYMDHLLESLPEDKIEEFAQSEYFDRYKKIFKELGLV
jgi:hypothetical protein